VAGPSGVLRKSPAYRRLAERSTTYSAQLRLLFDLILALDKRGLKSTTVSSGGTGTLAIDCREGILTEHQAGSYIFMDVEYNAVTLGGNAAFATSLFVHSTVVSNNVPGQATMDAGLKSFATDGPRPKVSAGAPDGTTYAFFGDEHGVVTFPEVTYQLPIGSIVWLETPHCDPTVNLHDYLHIVQGDTLIDIWRIDGRGVLLVTPRKFSVKVTSGISANIIFRSLTSAAFDAKSSCRWPRQVASAKVHA
jgi:D-serine deaminase-like pyridoxal phosphate-dependent protein